MATPENLSIKIYKWPNGMAMCFSFKLKQKYLYNYTIHPKHNQMFDSLDSRLPKIPKMLNFIIFISGNIIVKVTFVGCPNFPTILRTYFFSLSLSHYMFNSGHKMTKIFKIGTFLGLPLFI